MSIGLGMLSVQTRSLLRQTKAKRMRLPRIQRGMELRTLDGNDTSEGHIPERRVIGALEELSAAIHNSTGVLLYCKRGANRSPLIAAMWLVRASMRL